MKVFRFTDPDSFDKQNIDKIISRYKKRRLFKKYQILIKVSSFNFDNFCKDFKNIISEKNVQIELLDA